MLAHFGQKYNGEPYWSYHLKSVVQTIAWYYNQNDPSLEHIAWLHDLLEDTRWPLPFWLTQTERDAIILLTHQKGVPYFEYIKAMRGNNRAVYVKIADAEVNLHESLRAKHKDRISKYEKALAMFGSRYPTKPMYCGMPTQQAQRLGDPSDNPF